MRFHTLDAGLRRHDGLTVYGMTVYGSIRASLTLTGGLLLLLGTCLSAPVMAQDRVVVPGMGSLQQADAGDRLLLQAGVYAGSIIIGRSLELIGSESSIIERIGQTLFSALMLVSPSDTYRLLNLTAFESVGQVAGIAGVAARSGFGVPLLLGLMTTWVALPLAATMAVFHRREL